MKGLEDVQDLIHHSFIFSILTLSILLASFKLIETSYNPFVKIKGYENSLKNPNIEYEVDFEEVLSLMNSSAIKPIERLEEQVEAIGCSLSLRLNKNDLLDLKIMHQIAPNIFMDCNFEDLKDIIHIDDINQLQHNLTNGLKLLKKTINENINNEIQNKTKISHGRLKTKQKKYC